MDDLEFYCVASDAYENDYLVQTKGVILNVPSIDNLKKIRDAIDRSILNHNYINKIIEMYNQNKRNEGYEEIIFKEKKPTPGYIYLIKCTRTGHYKIGQTQNVNARIKQLKTANTDIEFVLSHPVSDVSVEKVCHKEYEDYKVRGEWFEFDEDLLLIATCFILNLK